MKRKGREAGTDIRRIFAVLLAVMMMAVMVLAAGCSNRGNPEESSGGTDESTAEAETNASGDIVVLFTSDVHCGVDQGWGYAGLQQIRNTLESNGDQVLLVDNGDAIQGEPIGTLSSGKAVAELMGTVGYDVAIPGNHEFDYGMETFTEIAGNSTFPYICCNLMKDGETVLEPYMLFDKGGKKIAFIGVTTPTTITSATPKYFQDDKGNFIYDFLQQDKTGQAFYDAVQRCADSARADGADYVILLGHLGMGATCKPWDYASVAENTSGIDAILDGHSHDFEQVMVKNKDGVEIPRSACGTKLKSIGWLRISHEDGSITTGLYDWNNEASAPEILGLDNDAGKAVAAAMKDVDKKLSVVIGKTNVDLTIYDPKTKTDDGQPVRIVRTAETNLGDLVTDAFRDQTGADVAMAGGGTIRADIPKGEFTKGDVLSVMPFNEDLCVAEVTGQQILDALEWGVHKMPNDFGGFMQVSGMSYEIDMSVPDSCTADANGLFSGVEGERRVKNVMIGDKPVDPAGTYTLASDSYHLKEQGDGLTMFSEEDVVRTVMIDNEAVMKYIEETLGGVVGEEYADPYGQGRIVATEQ